MAGYTSTFYRFVSGLYAASRALEDAMAFAPDSVSREHMALTESQIRSEIRRHHLPSPDEERIFLPDN